MITEYVAITASVKAMSNIFQCVRRDHMMKHDVAAVFE
jgi:hypothetical protein